MTSRWWRALGLRWQLVLLNVGVVGITVGVILLLMHTVGEQPLMHFVQDQLYPTIAAAAVLAIVLNFVVVTFALRPLNAVRDATRLLARGDSPAHIETTRRDEIGDVADSVNELTRSLQQLEDLRRQVTNDVAHELRTPLHNLLGLIEGMRDEVIPTTPDTLERSRAEVGRLIRLVDDLRALADAQLARDRLERAPVHLNALIRDVMAGFASAMTAHRLTYRAVGAAVGAVVEGDAGRLAQVLRNIVDNALQYALPDTIVVIAISARPGARVRVAVSDEGVTIDEAVLPHIFERFFRADPSRTRGSGGAGIGLAIVRELVEAHGGSVGAASDSRGVTVWFELPRIEHLDPVRDATRRAHATSDERIAATG